ncbi:hypothetical protein C8P63_1375 [Melghirimyces profundicolus]|uniref:Uncharacterized protein n=1 Tax=Melghirimyces profundicolus TaxID=1242148 RepID=A0A2T6B2N9_9BACL|nr:hypothetical protein C8P63_1375 [Melghirimyces profundicolus]
MERCDFMFVLRKGEAFTQNSDFAVLPSGEQSARAFRGKSFSVLHPKAFAPARSRMIRSGQSLHLCRTA